VLDHQEDGEKLIWLFDIRERSNPVSISTFKSPTDADYKARPEHFGPHNLHENRPGSFVTSELIFATYQNAGVRVFDIRDRYAPREVGALVPPFRRDWSMHAMGGRRSSSRPMCSSMQRG
jgi:hypothetical protein